MPKKTVYFVLSAMMGGGAEKNTLILLNNINRQEFNVKLILFNKKGVYLDDIPKEIDVIDLKKRSRFDFIRLVLKLRRVIINEKPDIVFSSLEYPNIITLLAGVGLTKTKIIISEHVSVDVYLPRARLGFLKMAIMKKLYRNAYKVILVSKRLKDSFKDFKLEENKIEVINNPIEINKIKTLSAEKIDHPFFSGRDKKFIIISVGRLTPQKNQALLIKAVAGIKSDLPIYVIFVGEGELKDDLSRLSKVLGISPRTDFVGFKKNPYAWIKNADLFVLSSDFEGFGNVIVEAMACGVPVISTRCHFGPEEIIEDHVNGILVGPQDADAMKEAIIKMMNDAVLRNKLKEHALNSIDKFEAGKIVKEYERVFV